MIESRCGLICSFCTYKGEMHCAGCTKISKPFWGDTCPVKSCCEKQAYTHCGQCVQFPCPLLRQFAYDPEQGDDGQRIIQLQKWAAQQKS